MRLAQTGTRLGVLNMQKTNSSWDEYDRACLIGKTYRNRSVAGVAQSEAQYPPDRY